MKRLAVLLLFCLVLTGCSSKEDPARISFKEANKTEFLKSLDGKEVNIKGYLATSSPTDGSFIFLMNLPYQNCPFCVPNTSELVNTLECYPKDGEKFSYTNQTVNVTGTLEFCKDGMFTDMYGYEFPYRLVNAEMTLTDLSDEQSEKWNRIAESGVVEKLYELYDYAYFMCSWNEYYMDGYKTADGSWVDGKYMPVEDFYDMKGSWNIDFNALAGLLKEYDIPLSENVEAVKALTEECDKSVKGGEYTSSIVDEGLGFEGLKYRLNRQDEFVERYNVLYSAFSNFINEYEV